MELTLRLPSTPYCILNSADNYASSFENKEIVRLEGGLSSRLPTFRPPPPCALVLVLEWLEFVLLRILWKKKACSGKKKAGRGEEERGRSRWEGNAARQTSGWRAEEQTLKNGGGQMRVLFTRSCMRSSRCRYSRFPLFEDFYNWRETVSRINASAKGRSSELFNGIIITCSLDITFLSSFHRSRPFLHAPLPSTLRYCSFL